MDRYSNLLCGVYSLKWSYGQILQSPLWSVQLKVVLWTDTPISAVELCSFFRVIFGLFVASLINALLAWSVSFGGRPSLGRLVVVPYPFHFLITDLIALLGMFKVSDIILKPIPDLFGELLGLHGATCFGGAPCLVVLNSGAFQNRFRYTEIM